MIVEFRPSTLPKWLGRWRYIIIHDMTCMFKKHSMGSVIDTDKKSISISKVRNINLIFNKQFELNYHFFGERIKDDYELFVARPMIKLCEYDDIKSEFAASIHVGLMGNYSIINANARIYRAISYKVLFPLMVLFKISRDNIFLHHQVSRDKDVACPGNFFDYEKLMSYLTGLMIR